MTTATAWTDRLRAAGACREAVRYAEGYPSFQAAWDACERGDWMLGWIGWTVARDQGPERRRLVKVACQCARLALPSVPAGEDRSRLAIETEERWATGDPDVSIEQVRAAAAYAAAAAANAAADAAAAAAYDAAYADVAAADAYDAAAADAYDAAYAAAAANAANAAAAANAANAAAAANAANAAAYAAAAAARARVLHQCADLVRASYPRVPGEE